MEALTFLENSYICINKNFNYYKNNYGHSYYYTVKPEETLFIDKIIKGMQNDLSPQDKMLNFSISTIYTATSVLLEVLNRKKIQYTADQIERFCIGYNTLNCKDFSMAEKSYEELYEILFELLTDGIDLESRKKSGSERTPKEIIDYMLDLIEYNGNDITNKRITDPSCGTGTFIARIFDRLASCDGFAENINVKLLHQKCVVAYDTKPSNVYVTKIVIVLKLLEHGLLSNANALVHLMLNLPIYCMDFLKTNITTDYLIGNPPYIRLQNLSPENRDFIKDNFKSATGRFDIYICFLEKGNKLLNQNGKLCLITSNKFLTANYGVGIRKYLVSTGRVRKIIDLFDTKFFGAAVLPAITVCKNTQNIKKTTEYIGIKTTNNTSNIKCSNATELFNYVENVMHENKCIIEYKPEEPVAFEISKSTVILPDGGKTWNFSSGKDNDIKAKLEAKQVCTLGDIFDVCVGIKTTADTVFVKPMTKEYIEKNRFEKNVVFPLIQSFDVEKWAIIWGESKRDRYILYPHREIGGNMVAVPLDEIPNVANYLLKNEAILKKRSYLVESKTREWYECWVPQKLSKFQQPKIVTRDIVSHNSFALDVDGRLCQGNTFFLTKKISVFNSIFSNLDDERYYYFILGILNSKVMEYYQKMISGCLYSQKYRYTSSNLNRWPIPYISVNQANLIIENVMGILNGNLNRKDAENAIDNIIYQCFDLSDEDIETINDFIKP